jgi:excisionase family DNA binding protein
VSVPAIPRSPVPRLALTPSEAAQSLGVSADFFREHVDHQLRWNREGRKRLVAVAEVERWLTENAERVLPEEVSR